MFSLMANCFAWIRRRKEPSRAITLVIIGLDDAGKTTMVAGLQGEPPDGITPTIGFANAELTLDGFKVTVYDLGGGVRIRDVWRNYYPEVFGVVFVIDSCNAERLEESKDVLQQVAEHAKITGKPFLVFANKQDKGGSIAANEVSDILDLDALSSKNEFQFKVVGCSALKGYGRSLDKGINTGFRWLLSTISNEFSKISARVEHDMAIKKEEEEIERKARAERIRKIREERDRLEREAGRDPDKEESDDEVRMANPWKPINKHLDNVKARDKKKKIEKEKKEKVELEPVNLVENKPTEDDVKHDSGVVIKKKKKKKKKKLVKTTQNGEIVTESQNGPITHVAFHENDNDDKTHHVNSEDHPVVVKKKKKKVKVINDDVTEGLKDDENDNNYYQRKKFHHDVTETIDDSQIENIDDSVTVHRKKKQKKKKKDFTAIEENSAGRDDVETERYELETIQNGEAIKSDPVENDVVVKKPKRKKRKKKTNKTYPINDDDTNKDILPPPAWKTSPRTWTSLPPIGGSSGNSTDLHSSGLPPLNSQRLVIGDSSSTSLQKLSMSPSWTRPNSEDNDIVT